MATGPLLGLEHEYSVWEGPGWLDARALFESLDLPGVRIHPSERQRVVLGNGLHVLADGPVLEAATPPVEAGPGAARALVAWAGAARQALSRAVPMGLRLEGESTHLSVSVDPALAEPAALLFTQTFAPGLMLLMDRPSSPGLLVRPRPRRLELCGEFVDGPALEAAALYALAGTRACEAAARRGDAAGLPPGVEMAIEPARLRFGWYVGPEAAGADLHSGWRSTPLRLLDGSVVSAGDHLRRSWETARWHLSDLAAPGEVAALDAVVSGSPPRPAAAPPSLPSSATPLTERRRPGVVVTPVVGTWEFVAFRVAVPGASVVMSLPSDRVAPFLSALDAGALDRVLPGVARSRPLLTLEHHDQTAGPGVFRDVVVSERLLPTDYMGVGNAALTPVLSAGRLLGLEAPVAAVPAGRATGKPPVAEPPPVAAGDSGWPWWVWLVPVVAVLVTLLLVLSGGGSDTTPPTTPDTTAPEATTTTVPPPVVPPPLRPLAGLLAGFGYDGPAVEEILSQAVDDAAGDGIYSASVHRAGDFGPDVDITNMVAVSDPMEQPVVDAAVNRSIYECGDGVTVCPEGVRPLPPGPVVLVGAVHRGPLPRAGEERAYTYAAVFDADGRAANDYVASPPFDWDLFQGADLWYQLHWDPATASYRVEVQEWRGFDTGPVTVPSAARALVRGTTILWVIPASEFTAASPGVRITSFRHDGSFLPAASGADVPGPHPARPLFPVVPLDLPQLVPLESTPSGPSPRQVVEEFVTLFNAAHAEEDVGFLLERLHPAVLSRYDRDQCRAYLEAVAGTVQGMEVQSVEGPARQPYTTDGLTTRVPRGYAVRVRALANGEPARFEVHFAESGGTLRWFTDCGDPG